jgi:hypothetical protein
MVQNEIIERLKFYAITETNPNQFFCYNINSIVDLEARLLYFSSKYQLKAAWYELIENGIVKENRRIDLVSFYDSGEALIMNK